MFYLTLFIGMVLGGCIATIFWGCIFMARNADDDLQRSRSEYREDK